MGYKYYAGDRSVVKRARLGVACRDLGSVTAVWNSVAERGVRCRGSACGVVKVWPGLVTCMRGRVVTQWSGVVQRGRCDAMERRGAQSVL